MELEKIEVDKRIKYVTDQGTFKFSSGYNSSIHLEKPNGEEAELSLGDKPSFSNLLDIFERFADDELRKELEEIAPNSLHSEHRKLRRNRIVEVLKGEKTVEEAKEEISRVEEKDKEKENIKSMERDFESLGYNSSYGVREIGNGKMAIIAKGSRRDKQYYVVYGGEGVKLKKTSSGFKSLDEALNGNPNALNRLQDFSPSELDKAEIDVLKGVFALDEKVLSALMAKQLKEN